MRSDRSFLHTTIFFSCALGARTSTFIIIIMIILYEYVYEFRNEREN